MAGRDTHLPAFRLLALRWLAGGGSPAEDTAEAHSIPTDRAVLALQLCGEIRATQIKITDVAGFINFVRLLPKTAGSLWLCVFGLHPCLGVKNASILSPGTCEECFLFVLMIFHAQNPSGGEEMRLPGPVAGAGIATQGSRFPFSFLVCCFPICKIRLIIFVL